MQTKPLPLTKENAAKVFSGIELVETALLDDRKTIISEGCRPKFKVKYVMTYEEAREKYPEAGVRRSNKNEVRFN